MNIEVPVIFGDARQSGYLLDPLHEVKQSLMQIDLSGYGSELERMAILLMFPGEIWSFGKPGLSSPRLELKRKRIGVNYTFEGVDNSLTQPEMVAALRLCFSAVFKRLRRSTELQAFNVTALEADVEAILGQFR